MAKPEVGKSYNVNHCRKGEFSLSVTDVGKEWITGRLIAGAPHYLNHYNEKELCESMTVRASFCSFEEVTNEVHPNREL